MIKFIDSENKYSRIWTFLVHQQQGPLIVYLRIVTDESTLETTPSHLILMRRQGDKNPLRYLQATRLRPGNSLFSIQFNSNSSMKEINVIRIDRNVKRTDAYAPLTESGTLVIDGIVVSCYAQYEYHSLIHLFMFPIRLWKTINSYQRTDFHPYINFWLGTSHYLDLLIHTI